MPSLAEMIAKPDLEPGSAERMMARHERPPVFGGGPIRIAAGPDGWILGAAPRASGAEDRP